MCCSNTYSLPLNYLLDAFVDGQNAFLSKPEALVLCWSFCKLFLLVGDTYSISASFSIMEFVRLVLSPLLEWSGGM